MATAVTLSGEDIRSQRVAVYVAQLSVLQARLPAVLETLERRRAQGTLCAGRCRAHEVAWEAGYLQAEALARANDFGGEDFDEVRVSLQAHCVGVVAYFATARMTVRASKWLMQLHLQHDPFTALCLTFIEHALQFALEPESLLHSDKALTTITSTDPFSCMTSARICCRS